jgi:tryptophanase
MKKYYDMLLPWLPVYEGFATYGGMSTHEVEAMAVGIREMADENVAGSGAEFVRYFVERCVQEGIPAVTPAGGLACHIDARRFLPHIPQEEYPAGALTAAIYIASGVRSMERGTISSDRDENGNDILADLELARLAVPRRVYTMSQIELGSSLKWCCIATRPRFKIFESALWRFFFGKLEA